MKDIVIPELVESILSGTISSWLVEEGDFVNEGDSIIELETDKIVVDVHAETSGRIAEIIKGNFEDVNVGEVVGKIDESATTDGDSSESQTPQKSEETTKSDIKEPEVKKEKIVEKPEITAENKPVLPNGSPAARKSARENGTVLKQMPTQNEMKPVQKEEEQKYSSQALTFNFEDNQLDKPIEVERFSRRRQTIANRLVEAQRTMAMLTTFNEVDMSAIMELRKSVQDDFVKKNDIKLGFMSFFVKAVVGGLKQYPAINSELRGDQLILKKYYDLSIAVSSEEGLVVPVIHGCDRKSFAQIEKDIKEVADKARCCKLTLEDLQGGTFTITNGGIFGSAFSTPIINMPQAAILGMHNIFKRVVPNENGEFVEVPMMQIALTYDHRIVDGKDAASFLTTVKHLLEDPTKLLLEG